MIETLFGSFLVIVAAGALLGIGQWFGRPPIRGKCSPDNTACCLRRGRTGRCPRRGET